MSRRHKPHEDIRFTSRRISLMSVLSVAFSVFALVLLPAAVYVSCLYAGGAGAQVGAMGMLGLVCGIIGWSVGAGESRNDEINRSIPRTGARIGILAVILWAVIFLIGLRG